MKKLICVAMLLSSVAFAETIELNSVTSSFIQDVKVEAPVYVTIDGATETVTVKEDKRLKFSTTEAIREIFVSRETLNAYLQNNFCGQTKQMTAEMFTLGKVGSKRKTDLMKTRPTTYITFEASTSKGSIKDNYYLCN